MTACLWVPAIICSDFCCGEVGCSRIVKGMTLTREFQRTAQICCLCCAYVSSGTGRLVN